MAANVGRATILTWGDDSPPQGIAGVRQKDVSVAGSAVDITSDDDSGWMTLLSVAGEKSVTLKLSGVTKNQDLLADWFNGSLLQTATLTYPSGAIISGSFFLSEYSDKASYKEGVVFDATLQSSGAVTYTPAP